MLWPHDRGTGSQPIIWLEKSCRREWRTRCSGQLSKCGPETAKISRSICGSLYVRQWQRLAQNLSLFEEEKSLYPCNLPFFATIFWELSSLAQPPITHFHQVADLRAHHANKLREILIRDFTAGRSIGSTRSNRNKRLSIKVCRSKKAPNRPHG